MTDADLPSDEELERADTAAYQYWRGAADVRRALVEGRRAVARLAQQRERERLAAAAGDAAERVGHAPLCDWGLGACSCGSIDAIAALQARHEAEVFALHAQITELIEQRDEARRRESQKHADEIARLNGQLAELRGAAQDAVSWGPANEALKWLVKFARTEHSSALLEICDGSTVELLDCIIRLRAALATKAGGA
jgi:hypothetical protein